MSQLPEPALEIVKRFGEAVLSWGVQRSLDKIVEYVKHFKTTTQNRNEPVANELVKAGEIGQLSSTSTNGIPPILSPALIGLRDDLERRQQSKERVLDYFYEILESSPQDFTHDSKKIIDNDFLIRFFENCQDITDEQVLRIYAALLSNDVKQPGSFSRRTLDVLRNFSKPEAMAFKDISALIMETTYAVYDYENNVETELSNRTMWIDGCLSHVEGFLTFDRSLLAQMDDAGLIRTEQTIRISSAYGPLILRAGRERLIFGIHSESASEITDACVLTQAGSELSRLFPRTPPSNYVDEIILQFERYKLPLSSRYRNG